MNNYLLAQTRLTHAGDTTFALGENFCAVVCCVVLCREAMGCVVKVLTSACAVPVRVFFHFLLAKRDDLLGGHVVVLADEYVLVLVVDDCPAAVIVRVEMLPGAGFLSSQAGASRCLAGT